MAATTFSAKAAETRRRILLVLVAGVPLLFLRNALDPINVPKLALLMVGLSVVVALRVAEILQGESPDGLRRVLVPAATMVGPLLIAWTFSPYRGWALFGQYPRFTGLLPYFVVALFGVMLADAFQGRAREVAWALLIAGGIAGAYALIQSLNLDPLSWTVKGTELDVVASTLGNPNFVGAFLGMALVVGLALLFAEPERRAWAAGLVVLTAIGWVVARSEGGWAGALAGICVAGGIYLSARFRPARVLGLVAAGTILLAVIGSVVLAIAQGPESGLPDTAKRRADWWQGAASMTVDSPIVGRGPSTFALEHSRYRTANDAIQVSTDITDDPHSVLLSFLSGAGIIGAVGLIATIVWVVRRGVQLQADNVLGAGFFGAFIAYLVQASISIDTIALRTAMWTAVAGMVVSTLPDATEIRSRAAKKRDRARPAPIRNLPAVVAISVVALIAVWLSGRFLTADTRALASTIALTEGDYEEGHAAYLDAVARRDDVAYRQEYGNDVGALAAAFAAEGEREPTRRLIDEAKDAFAFIDHIPDVGAVLDLAQILRNAASVEPAYSQESFALYKRAIELDPNNKGLVGDAALVALAAEDYEGIVDLLEEHPALDSSAGLKGTLSLAYFHLGREEEARRLAERALSEDPNQSHAQDTMQLLERG